MDRIKGKVTNVVDGDTFDVNVTWVSPANTYKYNVSERIRINQIDAPEVYEPGYVTATDKLRRRIGGKMVSLAVHSRDAYRRLICDVSLV